MENPKDLFDKNLPNFLLNLLSLKFLLNLLSNALKLFRKFIGRSSFVCCLGALTLAIALHH